MKPTSTRAPRGPRRRISLVLAALAPLAAATTCGPPATTPQTPDTSSSASDEAPLPTALATALAARGSTAPGDLWLRIEETEELATPTGPQTAERVIHVRLSASGLAMRTEELGVVTQLALGPDGGWLRRGAAVDDLIGAEAARARLLRDDLLCMVVTPVAAPPFRTSAAPDASTGVLVEQQTAPSRILRFEDGAAHPAQIVRSPASASGQVAENAPSHVTTLSEWSDEGGWWFPRRIVVREERPSAVGEARGDDVHGDGDGGGAQVAPSDQAVEITAVVTALSTSPPSDGDPLWMKRPLSIVRPNDSGGEITSEIERRQIKGANVVIVEHAGPLTDLAKVDAFLDRGLKGARMSSRSRRYREFSFTDDGSTIQNTRTVIAVRLSHDPGTEDLPSGARVTFLPKHDVLAVRYRGPYARSEGNDAYAALRAKAAELGLTATGPIRHVVLGDPDAGDPSDLEQELQLPVK